jgi:hypothetical protein
MTVSTDKIWEREKQRPAAKVLLQNQKEEEREFVEKDQAEQQLVALAASKFVPMMD